MRNLLLGLALMVSAFRLSAEPLSLQNVLQHVINTHPAFVAEQYNPKLLAASQREVMGIYDWRVSGNAEYDKSRTETSDYEAWGRNFYLNLNKTFWSNGMTFRGYYSTRRHDHTGGNFVSDDKYYYANLDAELAVPLWYDFAGVISRSLYEQFDYQIKSSKIHRLENEEGFIAAIASAFIDLVYRQEQLKFYQDYLQTVQAAETALQAQSGSQAKAARALLHLQGLALEAQQSLQSSTLAFKAAQADFFNFINLPPAAAAELSFDLYTRHDLQDSDDAIAAQMQQARLLQPFHVETQRLEHERGVTQNSKAPRVDLTLGGRMDSDLDDHFKGAQDQRYA